MLKDATGREFNDELTNFFKWYMSEHAPTKLYVPVQNGISFSDGATGVVIYREDPYQVQLFIVEPNFYIPEHVHPNVDSYEVFLDGMTFSHSGDIITHAEDVKETEDGLADKAYEFIRVLPSDKHGGQASAKGGCFLSVQKWLHDVEPASVGDDWVGEPMGPEHTEQISSFQKDQKSKKEAIKAS